jgi:hypothetical protein
VLRGAVVMTISLDKTYHLFRQAKSMIFASL